MANKIGISNLTKQNSETIGFVIECFLASSISLDELNQWAVSVVNSMEVEDIPGYIFDLVSFDGFAMELYKVIGFVPVWSRSDEEEAALFGIAISRGKKIIDMPISSKSALESLRKNPEILEAFNKIFPFAAI